MMLRKTNYMWGTKLSKFKLVDSTGSHQFNKLLVMTNYKRVIKIFIKMYIHSRIQTNTNINT